MPPQEPRQVLPTVELEIVEAIDAAIVKLRGEHDFTTKPSIREALTQAAARAPRVVVDLSECTFADSSLVQVLVEARARFRVDGVVIEVVIPPAATAVRRLAQLVSLAEILPVYESRVAAIDNGPAQREVLS